MPIYEYRCKACGHVFETITPINGKPPGCPACSSREIKRLISKTNFALKGDGWYATDYGKKPAPKAKKEGES